MKVTTDGKRITITDLSRHDAKMIASALAGQSQSALEITRKDGVTPSQKRIIRSVGGEMDALAELFLNVIDKDGA